MRILQVEQMSKIKKAVPEIEKKVKVKISFRKGSVAIKGNELNEFLVEQIIRAVDFGFYVDDALLLTNENFVFEFISIKENTRRKNLGDVRSRVIGTDGKAKRTIEKLTGCIIVINENTVGIIVDSIHLDSVVQALESLIRGAKHGNVFAYLEKQNISRRKFDDEDLGLKDNVDESLFDEDDEDN